MVSESNIDDDKILTKMASMEICYDPVYYKKERMVSESKDNDDKVLTKMSSMEISESF